MASAHTTLYSFWVLTSALCPQNAAFISTSLHPTSHQGWGTESESRILLTNVRNPIEVKQFFSSLQPETTYKCLEMSVQKTNGWSS